MSQITPVFSPRGGCEAAIVEEIARAKVSIYVQIFSFTSKPIAIALIAASARKVAVSVIGDPYARAEPGGRLDILKAAGLRVWVDSAHHLQHNKVMVVDSKRVVTGSFNWSYSAEHGNAENLLLIHDAKLALKYLENWAVHAAHSTELEAAIPLGA